MGTLDVSVLELGDGVFEVLATNGDVELGGTDWDNALMDWLVSEFKSETGIDLSKDSMAVQRLKEEAEKAKIALSSAQTIDVNLPFITADASGPKHLNKTLTRAKFEQLTQHLVDRTVAPFKKSMEDANVSIEDINKVVLVGGQTRSPAIQALVNELTKKEPCKGVNPDECVAAGAAIQGSVLTGENTDILLLDVTPLSLGICVNQNEMNILIEKNTTIPAKKSQVYSTAVDNQPAVTIQVATGERPRFSDNKLLGTFNLEGIAPAPRGIPQIEVTFDIDANGILKVTAVDKGTGKEQSISITDSGNLSKEDIEKMKKDAELNAEADKKYKELSEAKNRAEGLVYAAEKAVEENKEKVAQELVDEVNKAVEEVKAVKDSEDVEAIKAKTEELNKAMMKIGEEIYKQQQAEAATQQPQENTTTEDTNTKEDPNVVDV
jgi:molecular chaperone DnaK